MGYSFMHIGKINSYYKIGRAYEHNYRTTHVSNAIPELKDKNEELVHLHYKNGKQMTYQEAWAEYRYKPSRVSGAMRSNYQTTLDAWHYADKYESQPILSSDWIDETSANIDRTLAVQSTTEDQFIADFYFACEATRPMPLYSIPGLIDHH